MSKTKLIIALDLETREQNLSLCKNLAKNNLNDLYLKVGLRSFIRDGVTFIKELQDLGFKVFLDLKLYDIPNTMLDSIKEIIKLNVSMITIHASSGRRAMSDIANYLKDNSSSLVFAVSALTSFSKEEFKEIYNDEINKAILNFSTIASECGINGIVCSPLESGFIKNNINNILTLTPGIRPISSDFNNRIIMDDFKDDQKRISSINAALKQKSDFIVIGRPIYNSKDPILITKYIISKLKEAK
ncbi:orotidine-5'-phosphate decarboxylase [Helicobacter sp. MIT 14-3879]|uniref:orotidine-5'-phosphate decarboxylase n=1 Tax=Helicobacter sp. MIT 14-3879 TaxID=2040649 RepID=UPI001C6A32D1|nr:orotidine-5'-phosphate decarboxylase [Helicobacter sp. MIT 14-3879]